jgi:MFS family permease
VAVTENVQHRHHVRVAFTSGGFRRLFAVRVLAQFADGVFQASLAGAVLFNPERQAHAADVAAGFAVLLLPYSLIGPFAGVLLDRWWRQRVLVVSCVLRAGAVAVVAAEIAGGLHGEPFYASALVVLSISRFFLSALSVSLPHVVGSEELVTANSLSTTFGGIATTAGGGAAIGVRALLGSDNSAYAAGAIAAVLPYLAAALVATRFAKAVLGPDDVERAARETLTEVLRGLAAGARHLRARRPAFLALAMITVHRVCYGLFAVYSVLLFRNYYDAHGVFRSGLAGLGQLVAAIAIGGGLAALATPPASRRLSFTRWAVVLLVVAAVVEIGFGLPYTIPAHLAGALLLAFCAQGLKISVDTILQSTVQDEFRGRVFAIYDTLFNLALVAAAVLTAAVLPANGRAPVAVVAIGAAYLLTAVGYGRLAVSSAPRTTA